jgi:hypothetical protein
MLQILKRIFRVGRRRFVRFNLHKKPHPQKNQISENRVSFGRRFSAGPLLFVQPLLLVCQRSPRGFHAHEGQPRLLVFGPLGKEGAILSIITKNIS